MTNPSNPFQPAIDALEEDLVEAERHVNALLSAVNVLRAKAGLPPRTPSDGGGGASQQGQPSSPESSAVLTQIKHDTFFGKRMGTAAREFLEMRKAQGQGPAKAREIFDALTAGGFQFNTKDDATSLVSLRNTISKNSAMFVKLPNGMFGLKAWYPGARPQQNKSNKQAVEEEEIEIVPDDTQVDNEPSAASGF